jgi:formate dehydrogenase major subunit
LAQSITARFFKFLSSHTKPGGCDILQGIPWHYGWITTADRKYEPNDKKPEVNTFGDAANILTSTIGDANTMIPESKAFMVNVVKKGGK